MKRLTLIIIAGLLIVTLLAIWVYSLVTGAPGRTPEIFTNLAFWNNGEITEIEVPDTITPTETIDTTPIILPKLRQLAFRPTVGYVSITELDNEKVRYAEAGTGHIYHIDVATGAEMRLSGITIATAGEAVFSQDGQYVAIRSGYTKAGEVSIIELTTEPRIIRTIKNITNLAFDQNRNLLYTTETSNGLEARSLNITSGSENTLFEIPFFEANVTWGKISTDTHLVYNKPASRLMGYVYEVRNNTLKRLPLNQLGLTAKQNGTYVIRTGMIGNSTVGSFYNLTTQAVADLPIIGLPEKCVFAKNNDHTLYCGYELTTYDYNFPDEWYKGLKNYSDSIWQINLNNQIGIQLANPMREVGKDIDMRSLDITNNEKMLYFVNNHDKTLWVYEI